MIRERLTELGISQGELAVRVGEHFQTMSAILNGKRQVPIPLSLEMDEALDFTLGTVALAQIRLQIDRELKKREDSALQERKLEILQKVKANGGFWSYEGIPEHLDDDAVIEAALVHLDLEDFPLLLQVWSRSHLKRIWKERLVRQGRRMNILNYILAVKFFGVQNPDQYISVYL